MSPRSTSSLSPAFPDLNEEIKMLADLFRGMTCPIFLVGGAGNFLHHRKSINHKDFDVSLFIDDLKSITDHLGEKGYSLVRRVFLTRLSPSLDLQIVRHYSPDQIDKRDLKKLRLRFVKEGPRLMKVNSRMEFLDIFLWQKSETGVHSLAYETTVPWNDVYPAKEVLDNSSLRLPKISNWEYFDSNKIQ